MRASFLAIAFTAAFVAPSPATNDRERPREADVFVDTIGVNTHLTTELALDAKRTTALIAGLGIRRIRDGIYGPSGDQYALEQAFFAATHVRMDGITDCPKPLGYGPPHGDPQTTRALIERFDSNIDGMLDALEGLNEPDVRGDPNWAPQTVSCIEKLGLDHVLPTRFLAPALAYPLPHAPKLGNISARVGAGNIHRYVSGDFPGTSGGPRMTACGSEYSLSWWICEARINAGAEPPVDATETGYSTPTDVDEITQGKYDVRLLLVDTIGGIRRTYLYDFHDDGTNPHDPEDGYGLVRYDFTPKPAYEAVRSLVAELADPGPPFATAPLTYAIDATPTVDHVLFEKRDGTFVLSLWNETLSWNPATRRPVRVPPQTVVVHLPFAPRASAARIADGGTLEPETVRVSGHDVAVAVDDHVTFLRFRAWEAARAPAIRRVSCASLLRRTPR